MGILDGRGVHWVDRDFGPQFSFARLFADVQACLAPAVAPAINTHKLKPNKLKVQT